MDTVHLISNLGITGDLERRRDVGDILSELSDTPFFCCTSIYHPSPTLQKIKYPYKYRRGGGADSHTVCYSSQLHTSLTGMLFNSLLP